jgi:IS1 family transposase
MKLRQSNFYELGGKRLGDSQRSFVDDKGNKQWVGLAIDVATREIVGCYIGDRSGASATALWESMPGVYRQCAVIYSDYWCLHAKNLGAW